MLQLKSLKVKFSKQIFRCKVCGNEGQWVGIETTLNPFLATSVERCWGQDDHCGHGQVLGEYIWWLDYYAEGQIYSRNFAQQIWMVVNFFRQPRFLLKVWGFSFCPGEMQFLNRNLSQTEESHEKCCISCKCSKDYFPNLQYRYQYLDRSPGRYNSWRIMMDVASSQ